MANGRDKHGKYEKGHSGNPSGARRADAPPSELPDVLREDGWQNALTGAGTIARDSRMSTTYTADKLTPSQCEQYYQGDDLAARIIDTRPNEMLREGWALELGDDDGTIETRENVMQLLDDLGFNEALLKALQFERAYGGGAVVMGANDGQDLAEPLNVERVTELTYFNALEVREIEPATWYTNPFAPDYGEPASFRVSPIATGQSSDPNNQPVSGIIHASRVLYFGGVRTSRNMASSNSGHGDSVLVRIVPVLRDFNMGFASAATLLQDFAPAVLKMRGLAALLSTDADKSIINRLKAVVLSRSTIGATLIDEAEEFERKTTPVAGLAELLREFFTRLASAADMPLTLLAGISPGGLNATGNSDVRFFYDRIAAEQPKKLRKPIKRVVAIAMAALNHAEPDRWGVAFNPLWQESTKEQAESRNIQAKTDEININTGVVSPEEIAVSRYGGSEYSFETTIDFDLRKKLEAPVDEPVGKPEPGPTILPPGFGAEPDDDETEQPADE